MSQKEERGNTKKSFVKHHSKKESKKYYKRIQDVTQEFKPRVNACRDASGKILPEKEDIQRRWQEYFQSVSIADPDGTDSMIFLQRKMKTYSQATRK
jgi:hypothetical protein